MVMGTRQYEEMTYIKSVFRPHDVSIACPNGCWRYQHPLGKMYVVK